MWVKVDRGFKSHRHRWLNCGNAGLVLTGRAGFFGCCLSSEYVNLRRRSQWRPRVHIVLWAIAGRAPFSRKRTSPPELGAVRQRSSDGQEVRAWRLRVWWRLPTRCGQCFCAWGAWPMRRHPANARRGRCCGVRCARGSACRQVRCIRGGGAVASSCAEPRGRVASPSGFREPVWR